MPKAGVTAKILTTLGTQDTNMRITKAIADALSAYQGGKTPQPLFIVPQHANPSLISTELEKFKVPENTAILLRTSGSTTGQGKIVALSWDNLISSAQATHEALGGAGVWVSNLPLEHIAGLQTIVRSLLAGYTPIFGEMHDPLNALRITQHSGNVYLSQVPTQLYRLLQKPTIALPYKAILVGGAALTPNLYAQAKQAGIHIVTSYGMTETGGGCVYNGMPIGDTQISLDPRGQISLCGSVVALGYLGEKNTNFAQNVDTQTRTFHTNDIGRFTPAGTLEVLGRSDDAITTGGLTIMPQLIANEITAKYGTHTEVIAIKNEIWGEHAIAIVESPISETSARTHLTRILGKGWAPRRIIPLKILASDWPTTTSGKINRRELKNMVVKFMQADS